MSCQGVEHEPRDANLQGVKDAKQRQQRHERLRQSSRQMNEGIRANNWKVFNPLHVESGF